MSEHEHHTEHELSDPYSLQIGFIVLGVAFFLVGSLIFSYFIYQGVSIHELGSKEQTERSVERIQLQAYEAETLQTFEWRDKEAGGVDIPIDLAMDAVVKEYRKKQN